MHSSNEIDQGIKMQKAKRLLTTILICSSTIEAAQHQSLSTFNIRMGNDPRGLTSLDGLSMMSNLNNLGEILSQATRFPTQFDQFKQNVQHSPLNTTANANWLFFVFLADAIAPKIRHGEQFDLDQAIVQTEDSISRVVGFRWQERYGFTIPDARTYFLNWGAIDYMQHVSDRVKHTKELRQPRKEVPDTELSTEDHPPKRTARSNPDGHDLDPDSTSEAPTTTHSIIEATTLVCQVLNTHTCTAEQTAKIALALQSLIAQTGG
jgi:hypothetical protein